MNQATTILTCSEKYKAAVTVFLEKHPDVAGYNGRMPPIDVCFVTEELPKTSYGDALDDLRKHDMQAFTYKGMITNAKRAYQEYIERSPDLSTM